MERRANKNLEWKEGQIKYPMWEAGWQIIQSTYEKGNIINNGD